MKLCLYCNQPVKNTHSTFCCPECSNKFHTQQKISSWLNGESTGTIENGQLSATIRNYLLNKANYKCELCGWGEVNPTTGKVPLEIHHIDGNYLNNTITNLQILCPNCHSLTPNYKALNKSERVRTQVRKNYCIDCGKEISQDALRCRACEGLNRREDKPVTRDELKNLIRTLPFTQIGKQYNVSDNAIKKWCISYQLPSKKKDINKYTEEEWQQL